VHEITVLFQPIVTPQKEVFGYEALVRGPRGSYPAEVLADARRRGALSLLEELIFKKALDDFKAACKLFFNVTKESAVEPGFIKRLVALAEKRGVAPRNVVLEVSESAIWEPGEFFLFCEKASSCGFIVALDDFGMRGANLALVGNGFPDWVKIARELVAGIDADRYKRMLALNLVETMLKIDIGVIVEGIEEMKEFETFTGLPVLFQGYLFSRPEPMKRVVKDGFYSGIR